MHYCTKCGKEIQEDARFCPYCGKPVRDTTYEEQVEQIKVPYPEAASLKLEIVIGAAGRVNISGKASENFVEGEIKYNVLEWAPRIDVYGQSVRLIQDPTFWDRFHPNPKNKWELRIGYKKPFEMSIKSGVSMGNWELGSLPVTGLNIDTGVSKNIINFGSLNPEVLRNFKLSAGVGDVRLRGLLNANIENMRVSGGAGEVELSFNGKELSRNAFVTIDGGVGSFKIRVDESVPTKAIIKGLTSISSNGTFRKTRSRFLSGGEYVNEAYESNIVPRLELNVNMGVGSIDLDTIKPS